MTRPTFQDNFKAMIEFFADARAKKKQAITKQRYVIQNGIALVVLWSLFLYFHFSFADSSIIMARVLGLQVGTWYQLLSEYLFPTAIILCTIVSIWYVRLLHSDKLEHQETPVLDPEMKRQFSMNYACIITLLMAIVAIYQFMITVPLVSMFSLGK